MILSSSKNIICMYQVEWKRSGNKGRGVFALKDFKKGDVIEECPVIPLTAKESVICETTILEYYLYPWRGKRDGAVVLGYGMLYNHSVEPNARYHLNYGGRKITYKAIQPIKKGEEILVNYNGDPRDRSDMELFDYRKRSHKHR